MFALCHASLIRGVYCWKAILAMSDWMHGLIE